MTREAGRQNRVKTSKAPELIRGITKFREELTDWQTGKPICTSGINRKKMSSFPICHNGISLNYIIRNQTGWHTNRCQYESLCSLQPNKALCNSTLFFSFQTPFHPLTHWKDNYARFRRLRSDVIQGKDVRFIPLRVCLARSTGLQIVMSVRLRAKVVFLPKHEVCWRYTARKKTKLHIYAKKVLGSCMCIYMYTIYKKYIMFCLLPLIASVHWDWLTVSFQPLLWVSDLMTCSFCEFHNL